MFLVSLDDHRRWYRYHRLFRDLLRYRLKAASPDLIPHLHRRASLWYEQNDFSEEAVSHAVSAEDFERAADLIERSARTLMMKGRITTLQHWLAAVPEGLIIARTQLALVQAWTLVAAARHEELESFLRRSRLRHDAVADDTCRGEIDALNARLAYHHGNFTGSIRLAERALALLPRDDLPRRIPNLVTLAFAHEADGDVPTAIELCLRAIKMSPQNCSEALTLVSLGKLVQLYALQARPEQADAAFDQANRYATERRCSHIPFLGLAHLGLGQVRRQQRDLKAATDLLDEGVSRCRQWAALSVPTLEGYAALARIHEEQGDKAKAMEVRERAAQLGRDQNAPAWALKMVEAEPLKAPHPRRRLPRGLPESLTDREQEVLRLLPACSLDRKSPQNCSLTSVQFGPTSNGSTLSWTLTAGTKPSCMLVK